jgi:quinol monooxygenase YgiN
LSRVILEGYITVPDNELRSIKEALALHIELTLEEEGCLVFRVTQDQTDRHKFNVYEEFRDRNAFDTHQVRVRESTWGQVSKNVDRHYHVREE